MKLKMIGCAVLKDEAESLAKKCGNELVFSWLPQGLHAAPDTLTRELQAEIDRTSPDEGFHAILVGYGLCGRGIEGVFSRNLPLVLPRTHDCIALFLGGHGQYLEQFRKAPGTYWFTRGFIQHGGQPGLKGKHKGVFKQYEETYEEYEQRFGHEIAMYLLEEWDQHWMQNYTRAAFVRWDYEGQEEHRESVKQCASNLGWKYEEINADLGILERQLSGKWHPDEFLVVLPGTQIVATNDERIIDALSPAEAAALSEGDTREETQILQVGEDGKTSEGSEDESDSAISEGLGIGIDAGGTFTDAVLYDFATKQVIASGKGLTTPHAPEIGVAEALAALPRERMKEVQLTSLATTFATNAIVEGKGCLAGLVLAGYDEWGRARIHHAPSRLVRGRHSVDGTIYEPFDEEGAREAIRSLVEQDGVEALALVSYLGCRNPEHEFRMREIANEICNLPTVCGHELSGELDSLRRATTAALNAKIAPVVVELTQAVKRTMEELGVKSQLVVVRADGSLVKAEEAARKPVEMILSGPAASLCGAFALTGEENAIVIDIGGTTSDVALLKGGRPVQGENGAVVGKHNTTVRAPRIRTSGLGGDSHIRVGRLGEVWVGPRRVLPLCRAIAQYPQAAAMLEELETANLAELRMLQPAELYLFRREPPANANLSELEAKVVEALRGGPLSILGLSRAIDIPYLSCIPVERLEDRGIILRCGLTPTDLLHVDGIFDRWDAKGARLALAQVARRLEITPEELAAKARLEIRRHLMETALAAAMGLDESAPLSDGLPKRLLHSAAADSADGAAKCSFKLEVPLIGIGAPAGSFIPDAAKMLGTRSIVPEKAGVAGAVGAITGSVMEELVILVRPRDTGGYVVHAPDEMRQFTKLSAAKEHARKRAIDIVRTRALASGAGRFHIRVQMENRHARIKGGTLYMETRVTAAAVGEPKVGEA